MRRSRKLRESNSVSLFPFLAVLICTFGVLIVLLVLVVKAANDQADAKKQKIVEHNLSELEELSADVELQEIRVGGLKSKRPDLIKQLQQSRQQRAHLQSKIDELTRAAKQLDAQIRLVSNEERQPRFSSSEVEIQTLKQCLETELAQLERKRQKASEFRPTKYSVVPHNGPDGTQRRPVYIECLKDKLIIQPYEIELTAEDFVRPIVANNPLDAALLAVREYFLENKLSETGQTPYPLLIVRPEGAEFYSVSRHAIRSWDEEFGYELISADKQLDFGKPDEQLARKMRAAIEAAKQRQAAYIAQQIIYGEPVDRGGGSDQPAAQGLQASSQLGGFVGPDGKAATGRTVSSESTRATQSSAAKTAEERQNDVAETREGDTAGPSSMASIADARGSNWALPAKSDRAVGYRRPVVVLLTREQMIINPNSQTGNRESITVTQPLSKSLENLVTKVWQQVEDWGVAGVNSYWMPELIFRVAPGCESTFRQVNSLMRGSGLEVRETGK